ncbi:Leucine-rich repeat (LRR) protein [Nonomuraea solani]|uniref:Leucine-rich repeat (LRR) protein n=1 Tax=Nonomuraea solani TaxID=1144553 RepID=A0A1H5XSN7_9ACTN|nr:leucine-rich repeat domain-containing protein [Nonomuraea solani]SEG14754.1 Leucine-rich repeat (LRR) protein [Nonomuraea solani]
MATPTAPDLAALRALLPKATPARAWRAIRELAIVAPTVSRPALELAAEFAGIALPPTERLLKFWPATPDPAGFAEFLLAPAFVREERTELRISERSLTPGLRHLSTLRKVDLRGRAFYDDIAELAGLTGLIELRLDQARLVTDFSPLAALTRLEYLDLSGTRISDLAPLAGMRKLMTLDLSHCRSLSDVRPLSGLPRLRNLDLGHTGVTALTGLRDLDALEELTAGSSATPLTSIDGIDALPALRTLSLEPNGDTEALNGGGPYHHLTALGLPRVPLPDLRFVSRFPALTTIRIGDEHEPTSLEGLAGHPSIAEVQLWGTDRLHDLSELPALRRLGLGMLRIRDLAPLTELRLDELDLDHLNRLTTLTGIPGVRSLRIWNCPELADLGALDDRLEKLDLLGCPLLEDPRRLTGLRGLKELHLDFSPASLRDLHGLDALTELHLDSDRPVSLDGLEGLPALRTLNADAMTGLDRAGHPGLAVLSLPRRPLPGLRFLARFPSLTKIVLFPEHDVTSLDALADHPSIATVELFGPPTVKDLSVLSRMPALRALTLGYLPDLDGLLLPSVLPQVEALRLCGIDGLRTLDGFTHLPALRSLEVSGCPRLRDLGAVTGLPSLERVDIHDCPDLTERGLL